MSETESSEYDDEDLSRPPRKAQTPVKQAVSIVKKEQGQEDETQDEEDIQELSPSQFRRDLKRKQEHTPPRDKKTNYAAIVRRSPNDGKRWFVCSAYRVTDGEKIVWSEAEEIAQITKRRLQKRAAAPPPPKRRKKISATTGVGVRRRVTAPARPRSLALHLGDLLKFTFPDFS